MISDGFVVVTGCLWMMLIISNMTHFRDPNSPENSESIIGILAWLAIVVPLAGIVSSCNRSANLCKQLTLTSARVVVAVTMVAITCYWIGQWSPQCGEAILGVVRSIIGCAVQVVSRG